jgi:hypothetical protein
VVERFVVNGSIQRHEQGGVVYHDDYARLQEQVETLTKERDARPDWPTVNATYEKWKARAEAAEAERDRLREMVLRTADQCDKWVKETYDGGWSTHQVHGQRALAESLRLAALQKEPQS